MTCVLAQVPGHHNSDLTRDMQMQCSLVSERMGRNPHLLHTSHLRWRARGLLLCKQAREKGIVRKKWTSFQRQKWVKEEEDRKEGPDEHDGQFPGFEEEN